MPPMTRRDLGIAGADITLFENVFSDPDGLFRAVEAEAEWHSENITLFGRTHAMPRLICWMGDKPYRYSGLTHPPAPFTPSVRLIAEKAAEIAGAHFNGVLLNLYRDGGDSMGWHADDEAELGPRPVIASVSMGAPRRMRFKPKKHFAGESFGIDLAPGSLLVMKGETQSNWLHAITKTRKPVGPRINLTFREILDVA